MNESDHPGPDSSGIQPWLDPELEARVVASVLGEASDFELAELERLLEENPELAVFKRRIEAVHGLVGESFSEASISTDDEWRMAPERREKLLNTLGVDSAGNESVNDEASGEAAKLKTVRVYWRQWIGGLSVAAAVLVTFAVLSVVRIKDGAPTFGVAARLIDNSAETSESDGANWGFQPSDDFAIVPDVPSAGQPMQMAVTDSLREVGNAATYSESLERLSNSTRFRETETETLLAQTEKSSLQVLGQGLSKSNEAIVPDLPKVVSGPAPPSSEAEPTSSPSSEPDVYITSKFVELSERRTAESGFGWQLEQGQSDDGLQVAQNQPVDAKLDALRDSEESVPRFEVAKNNKKGVDSFFFRSAGQKAESSYFAEAARPSNTTAALGVEGEEFASPQLVTRSGSEALVKAKREFIDPSERFLSEVAGKAVDPAVPEYAISEPYSTAGKVNMSYDMQPFDSINRAKGLGDVLDREVEVAANADSFGVNLGQVPEVIEFEGFVNYGNEKKAAPEGEGREPGGANNSRSEAKEPDVLWDMPQLIEEDKKFGAAQPQSGEIQRYSGQPRTSSVSAAVVPSPDEAGASISQRGSQADRILGGDDSDSQWASQPGAMLFSRASGGNVDNLSSITPGIGGGGSIQEGESQNRSGGQPESSRYHLYAEDGSSLAAPGKPRDLGRRGEQAPVADAQQSSVVTGGTTSLETTIRLRDEKIKENEVTSFGDVDSDGVSSQIVPTDTSIDGTKDINITLTEKNTGSLNFGAGFSTIDDLVGFVDVTDTNFDIDESQVSVGSRLKRRPTIEYGTTSDFDWGVGNAPDGPYMNQPETEARFENKERGFQVADGEVAKDGLELARTKAGNGEYDEARAILGKRLAEKPGDEKAQLLMSHLDEPDRYPVPLTPEHMKNVKEAERLLKLGVGYYDLGQYDKAKEQFAGVLEVDQHNTAARGLIEQTDRTLMTHLRTARDSMRSDMLRQVDELWQAPAPNTSPLSEESEVVEEEILKRQERVSQAGANAELGKQLLGNGNFEVAEVKLREALEGLPDAENTVEMRHGIEKQLALVEQKLEEKKALLLPSEFASVTTTEEQASKNAFSTFSLNVSDVAFKLAHSALTKGEWPEAEKMRVEEFVNALDYGDPSPAPGEKVACRTEQCAHPFMQQRNLLRIAMQTAAVGRGGGQPLRLTILLDHSGSMQREDREASVRQAMKVLAGQLQPSDQVSLIGFARTPRLLADRVSGSEGGKLIAAVDNAPSEGGTNLEEALRLAAEVAQRQFDDGAVNRIVLMTDGAANLGNADPEELATRVVELRQKGIAFDACGVGAKGLNDEVLEALTRKGDGRYYFLDAPEQADSGFASQLAGALRPAAKNVKVQVVFNPERVGAYRLIGYEKHRLKKEDFRNDAVDAAEMAAEEAGVALYQFEPKADGVGDIGEVRVRFQDVATGRMIEHNWIIPYEENVSTMREAQPSIQLAGSAAMLGEYLRGGPEASNVDLDELSSLAPSLRNAFGDNVRVNQLIGMIRDAQMAK